MRRLIGKGDIIYYARIHPETGIYDLCELRIRTIYPDSFVGVDKISKVAHLIDIDSEFVFDSRDEALKLVKEAEKTKKNFTQDIDEE